HLAEAILAGQLKDGDTVVFDIDKDGEIAVALSANPPWLVRKIAQCVR
ncbi:MAG: hypothetical protein HC800_21255, partial [Phormidesmis sp. RL_2_1]|nr:hypothetical protein [Phormidesmis sp. RL_2_1]